MIGSRREGLIDRRGAEDARSRPGGPLAIFGLILAAWVTGRVALWESPLPLTQMVEQAAGALAQKEPGKGAARNGPALARVAAPPLRLATVRAGNRAVTRPGAGAAGLPDPRGSARGAPLDYRRARRALGHEWLRKAAWQARQPRLASTRHYQSGAPFLAGETWPEGKSSDRSAGRSARGGARWSLDSWAFLREGSGSAPISQGRVPVYGASQIGAIARYRPAPASGHDPQIYLRAYRALIDPAESELAAGVSARPLATVPVRLAAEVRAVDDRFRREVRPAAYAITEIAPVALPLGLTGEVYAGAGYVGGAADTAFVDAQAALTRQVASFDLNRAEDLRLSLGAGAWGGAQRDADRLDVGPTVRIDLSLGAVPARVSIDYRERVGGDAFPPSGLAATLSTQF